MRIVTSSLDPAIERELDALRIDPDAVLEKWHLAQIRFLRRIRPKFDATWRFDRGPGTRFAFNNKKADYSASCYEGSIAFYLVADGWRPQQIMDAIVVFRREHDLGLRPYVSRYRDNTIRKAFKFVKWRITPRQSKGRWKQGATKARLLRVLRGGAAHEPKEIAGASGSPWKNVKVVLGRMAKSEPALVERAAGLYRITLAGMAFLDSYEKGEQGAPGQPAVGKPVLAPPPAPAIPPEATMALPPVCVAPALNLRPRRAKDDSIQLHAETLCNIMSEHGLMLPRNKVKKDITAYIAVEKGWRDLSMFLLKPELGRALDRALDMPGNGQWAYLNRILENRFLKPPSTPRKNHRSHIDDTPLVEPRPTSELGRIRATFGIEPAEYARRYDDLLARRIREASREPENPSSTAPHWRMRLRTDADRQPVH